MKAGLGRVALVEPRTSDIATSTCAAPVDEMHIPPASTSESQEQLFGDKLGDEFQVPTRLQKLSFDAVSSANEYHFAMMNFAARNDFYHEILRAHVNSDTVVLDIGTGSGLLSVCAVRLGARHVIAIESNPNFAKMAAAIFSDTGVSDKVTLINGLSTEVTPQQLPEIPNLLVSELVGGGGLLGQSAVQYIQDARERLLSPGSIILPRFGSQFVALVESEAIASRSSATMPLGVDMRGLNVMQNTVQMKRACIFDTPYELISEPLEVLRVDFNQDKTGMWRTQQFLRATALRSGTVHAAISYFELYQDSNKKEVFSACQHISGTFQPFVQVMEDFSTDCEAPVPFVVEQGETVIVAVQFSASGTDFQVRTMREPRNGGIEDVQSACARVPLRKDSISPPTTDNSKPEQELFANSVSTDFSVPRRLWNLPTDAVESLNAGGYARLNDPGYGSFYREMMRPHVDNNAVVLLIASQHPLLAIVAGQLGAHRVISIVESTVFAQLSASIVAENSMSDRVTIINAPSTRVTPQQLPEMPTVLVSDTFHLGYAQALAIPQIQDARDRLLARGGIVLPALGSQFVTFVESEALANWSSVQSLDLRRFNALQDTVSMRSTVRGHSPISSLFPQRRMSEPLEVLRVDYASGLLKPPAEQCMHVRALRSGTVHAAIVFWEMYTDQTKKTVLSSRAGPHGRSPPVPGVGVQTMEDFSANCATPVPFVVSEGEIFIVTVKYAGKSLQVRTLPGASML